MKLLFIADPLETFKTYKDSTFAMMREAAARGHELMACGPQDIMWQRGGRVSAFVRELTLTGDPHDWFVAKQQAPDEVPVALADVGAVIMRKDPPFDSEYFYATHLLEQAEREGARVFNRPRALRDHPEKLAILEFPQFIGPTRKMPMPPMPSSGFRMMSRCSAWKRLMSLASRVTSVGPMNCGNSRMASFSGWSRNARGRLKTRAPSRSACSSRWVA